jgi:pSer/pThr/pTyr-binding forkhead associated (FHA) protein
VVRIGRATDNDAVIPNQRVSRYHAQLRWVRSTWLVYDLESTNGTFVDDMRVQPGQPRPLLPNGTLRVGDHELRVVRS